MVSKSRKGKFMVKHGLSLYLFARTHGIPYNGVYSIERRLLC